LSQKLYLVVGPRAGNLSQNGLKPTPIMMSPTKKLKSNLSIWTAL